MAGTLQGPPGGIMAWKGAYNAGTTYAINDAVYANGSGYYSLQNGNVGHTPPVGTSDSYWSIFAIKGDIGDVPASGWVSGPTLIFGSATDAPNYTVTCAGDYSAIITPGMRMKMTQAGSVKYFLVMQSVYSSPNTTLTLYGGTDYTLGSTITLPYYSSMKAPAGFPMDPTKWTVVVSSAGDYSHADPVKDTWYNLSTDLSIYIPIGVWNVRYVVTPMHYNVAPTSAYASVFATLSTSNNGVSDTDFISKAHAGSTAGYEMIECTMTASKVLALAAKTRYYINLKSDIVNYTGSWFYIIGSSGALTKIIAVCAYL